MPGEAHQNQPLKMLVLFGLRNFQLCPRMVNAPIFLQVFHRGKWMVRIGNCSGCWVTSSVIRSTAAGKNPRHAWPSGVNSYAFPRTRKLGGSWVPKKVTAVALYVSIIFPIPKNHKKSPVSHKIPSYHHCCCPEAPKKSAQPVPRRCVHRKLQPIAARFTPEELLALGDRATGFPWSVLRKIGRKSGSHGMFSNKMMI